MEKTQKPTKLASHIFYHCYSLEELVALFPTNPKFRLKHVFPAFLSEQTEQWRIKQYKQKNVTKMKALTAYPEDQKEFSWQPKCNGWLLDLAENLIQKGEVPFGRCTR